MEAKVRCQSCGMPLGKNYFGTNRDMSESTEYCKFCYSAGKFTKPHMDVDDMVKISAEFMTKNLGVERRRADDISKSTIPKLKRWNK